MTVTLWSLRLCAVWIACTNAQECIKGPVWLFSLPEDLNEIYQGLTGTYVRGVRPVTVYCEGPWVCQLGL